MKRKQEVDAHMKKIIDTEVEAEAPIAVPVTEATNVTALPIPGATDSTLNPASLPQVSSIGWYKNSDNKYAVLLLHSNGGKVQRYESLCVDPGHAFMPKSHAENLLRVELIRRIILTEEELEAME